MREQIKKYFKPFPMWALWMIVGAVVLIAISRDVWMLCLLLAGIGGGQIAMIGNAPSDAQIDAWLNEDLKMLFPKALAKTGTDSSELVAESVMVTGPAFQYLANKNLALKTGKDGILRYSPLNVTIINFTENQLISYSCVFDSRVGIAFSERTDEYFYRDVVSVATKTQNYNMTLKDGKTVVVEAAEVFQLTTAGGTSIEVTLNAPKIIQMLGKQGHIPTTAADKAIQSVRKMLREKKSARAA